LTPCSGSAGTTVVITGTNLLKDSGTTTTAAVGGMCVSLHIQPRRSIPGRRRLRRNSVWSCRRMRQTDRFR
jgi:hypothetical protein